MRERVWVQECAGSARVLDVGVRSSVFTGAGDGLRGTCARFPTDGLPCRTTTAACGTCSSQSSWPTGGVGMRPPSWMRAKKLSLSGFNNRHHLSSRSRGCRCVAGML